ncbi:MAG: hypothetical protein AAB425_07030 [Bdellovibrionota bacterium]
MMNLNWIIALLVLGSPLTGRVLAHEGGHGTPSDPIAELPKIRTTKGDVFGVEGMLKGNQVVFGLRNVRNEVIDPKASGFKPGAGAEVTFHGATKPVKFELKLKGNFYEGQFKGTGESPVFKLALTETKGGKSQTVVIENIEQADVDHGHSH